jgi:hypothetical protein
MTDDISDSYPLAGWQAHSLPGASVLLVLKLVPSARARETGEVRLVPATMSASQARELATTLLRTAEATEMGQAPTTTRN